MTVLVDQRADAVWIGLDRPAKRNALDLDTVAAIDDAFAAARHEPAVIVVHSTTPGIFASGVDIAELRERRSEEALLAANAALFDRIEAHRWPTLALVDGAAFGGGCELALACDFRLGSAHARFAQPELSLGIIAGAGGNWRLPQTVGVGLARRMLYLGDVLDADASLRAGLLDEVVVDLEARAAELVATIADKSWRALELTKLALRSERRPSTFVDVVAQALLFESADKQERMTRFLEERERRRAARG